MSKQTQTQHQQQAENTQAKTVNKQEVPGLETAVSTPIPFLQRAYTDPLTPANAKTLQRTIGNQALGRLIIQRKMTLGPVGDKYEQEADAVAKQVVGNLQAPQMQSAAPATAQRQEEEELQMKPLLQRQEEEELQMKPLPTISALQRQEKEELQAKKDPMLGGGELSSRIETAVSNAKSGGTSLDNNIRQPMESAFNADFSGIKIHTGGQADNLNRSLSARAFTSGSDIFFREGEYNPSSSGGKELLAHELTHTIQQGSASLQRKPKKSHIGFNNLSTSSALNAILQRNSSSKGTEEPSTTSTEIVQEKKSALKKGATLKPGEGIIGAISKSATGTGGHSWVATEYLTQTGEQKGKIMHLTAAGGKGDSQSGGSGGSGESSGSHGLGDLSGSKVRKISASGSTQSAVVSNDQDSGFMSYSGSTNTNVGSAEPATFKGSVTININDADDGYLGNMAKKSIRTWDITETKGEKAIEKAEGMKALSLKGKYIYSLTGRTISFTKTGMNCARFAENVLNAAGIKANAGWIIKTPSELSTGKKAGFR